MWPRSSRGSSSGPARLLSSCCLVLVLLVSSTTSLKNLKIIVPERVRVGDSALLTCSYDLEDAQLYAIKWYFEDEEFYRFVPKKQPPHDTFPVRNIQVNVSGSNMQDVTLVNVRRKHTGRYKCEVSEDQPRYDTKLQEADIFVVDVPEMEPRIQVDKQRLADGDTLKANCTSGASRPAANVTWTVNGKPLDNRRMKFHVRTQSLHVQDDDRHRTRSWLQLDTQGLFQDYRLRLRCFAEIAPVYKASSTVDLQQDGPSVASPHSHQSSGSNETTGAPPWSFKMIVLMLNLILGILMDAVSTTATR
ncbi:uncharacterized protein LOC106653476 [Trichogramma pretiosum]|uniref:uncharacterized protein LOC106653476 n=1 Tax=Trichogramma pretiosum TaxID=7493 RepID=UPI0006C9DEC0|nr:uncharacterized protein LOC106653476 [Trichogramma pretiosum]